MNEVRYLEKVVFSTDDHVVPVTILYPSPLRPHEIADLREFFELWLRSQERRHAARTTSTVEVPHE